MTLQLRPNCEFCDRDLAPDDLTARICTYECTFCAECVETKIFNVCPNCGGGFAPRPIRPASEWRSGVSRLKQPPSPRPVHLKWERSDLGDFIERLRGIPPEAR